MNPIPILRGMAIAVLLSVPFGACADATAANPAPSTAAASKLSGSVATEEVTTTTTIRMGAIDLMFLHQGLGARFAPWRRSERDGTVTSGVRVALGLVESGPTGAALADDSSFEERCHWQLEPDSAQDLIAFVDRLAATKFGPRNADVVSRHVDAQWGDMRFKMAEDGSIEVFVFTNQQNTDIWSRFDPKLFTRSLAGAVERLQALRQRPQSVTMVR